MRFHKTGAWYKEWNYGTFAPHHLFSTEGATDIPRAAITLVIGQHSSFICFGVCFWFFIIFYFCSPTVYYAGSF